jgi:hypothetical protein
MSYLVRHINIGARVAPPKIKKNQVTMPKAGRRRQQAAASSPAPAPVAPRPRAVDPDLAGRDAAFHVFQGLTVERRAVTDTFDAAVAALQPRDRAFVRLLVATTLRRLGQIDAALAQFITHEPAAAVRDCLRLGAAQLLFSTRRRMRPWRPRSRWCARNATSA